MKVPSTQIGKVVPVSFTRLRLNVGVYYTINGPVKPMDFMCCLISEVVAQIKSYSKADDKEQFAEFMRICETVHNHTKKHNYSREGFYSYITSVILKDFTIEILRSLLPAHKFIQFPDSLDDDMILLFKVGNAVGSFKLRDDYGTEQFTLSAEEEVVVEDESTSEENTEIKKRVKQGPATYITSTKDLDLDPSIIALKKFYNTRFGQKTAKYFWQWKVCSEDYNTLRKLLKDVDFSTQTKEKIRRCATQLSLYIAEWYKREYQGRESNDCLGELNIGSNAYNEFIWENSGLPERGIEPFKTEETGRTEWLYSIRLLGGFPIKYTEKTAKFDALFCEIWAEGRDAGALSDEQIEELSSAFDGSLVVKNSLVSGSLKEYYAYLRKHEDMPIAESDKELAPFNTFIKNLQEGREKYYKYYIKKQWLFYSDPRENKLESELYVTFGRKEDNSYIPSECLKAWKIPRTELIDQFWIEVSVDDGISKRIRFVKSGPDNFPYVGEENSINLALNYSETACVNVFLITTSGERYPICEPFLQEKSIQVYKTAVPFQWSTKKKSLSATAVVYDPSYLSSVDSSVAIRTKIFEDNGREWNWVVLSEELQLVDEHKNTYSYVPYNNTLELSFGLLSDTIRYLNFRDVKVYMSGKDKDDVIYMPLMWDGALKVSYIPYNSEKSEKLRSSEYELFYRRYGDTEFLPFTLKCKPKSGVIQIKVRYKEMTVTKLVYYVPSDYPINRLLENSTITISHHFKGVYIPSDDTCESYVKLSSDSDGVYRYTDSLKHGFARYKDTIPFIIGDIDGECVEVNVYRAVKSSELYIKGDAEPILTYEGDSLVRIPQLLRSNFSVREINESGVKHTLCSNLAEDSRIHCYLFNDRNSTKATERFEIQLETTPEQYRFYFWSTKKSENPILVHQTFDENRKVLMLDLGMLEANENGIVFQSVKGNLRPRHYFKPIYGKKYIPGRRMDNVKCFDIASEHGIPYQTFDCLTNIFNYAGQEFLGNFLKEIIDSRGWRLSYNDCSSLHRFADEYGFDWIMLARRSLIKFVMKSATDPTIGKSSQLARNVINMLFRTNPNIHKNDKDFAERLLRIYWELPNAIEWDFRRSERIENKFAQCIRSRNTDYSILKILSASKRNEELKEFHRGKRLYEDTYFLLLKYYNKK